MIEIPSDLNPNLVPLVWLLGNWTGAGVVEGWYGELADKKPQIDLATDAVARTGASGPYSGGKRLYGFVNSDLMWVGEKQTPEVPLRPYMSAQLKKVVTPEDVAEMA